VPDGFRIATAYVEVEIDQAAVDAGIADVEAKLDAIRTRSVGVDIDQAKFDAALGLVEVKLDTLRGRALDVGFNQAELAASVAEIDALLRGLQSKFNIQVDLEGLPEAALGIEALQLGLSAAHEEADAMNRDFDVSIAEIAAIGINARLTSASIESMRDGAAAFAAEMAGVNLILGAQGGGWRANWLQWLHWILAGSAELAAVVLPATVALGAAAADAAQGFQMATEHMEALYTATEATSNMFHTTFGEALGLRSELQAAQNAANPMVYQAMGAAIEVAKTNAMDLASTGLQVLRIFDTFLAKVQLDLNSGGSNAVQGLLSDMVKDAVQIGEVFGNLGDAIVNLADKMPGLVHVLLDGLVAVTGLVNAFSKLPTWLVESVIGIEEFYRWGGLFITLFARMGAAIGTLGEGLPLVATFGGYFQTMVRTVGVAVGGLIINLGQGISKLSLFGKSAEEAGESVASVGMGLEDAAFSMGPGIAAAVVIGAVALGILIDKLVTAKTATEQWTASVDHTVDSVSNLTVLNTIAASYAEVTVRLQQNQKALQADADTAEVTSGKYTLYNQAANTASSAIATLTSEQQRLLQQETNVSQGVAFISKTYSTTFVGALALAQLANVKLAQGITGTGQSAEIARLKIADLVAGYEAMGQPLGVVGKDMTALAIDSGLQATQVGKLNTAWDDFMTNLTGGTGGLANFETSLTNLTTGSNTITNILGTATSVTLTAKGFAKDLAGATGDSATAWQNFDQVVGSTAPQLIDWFRTAGAEGEMSGGQFTQAVKDMVQQLLPFASHSAAALAEVSGLAQQAGGPATDSLTALTQWAGKSANATKSLQDIIDSTTVKMGNMASVAQNLGNVMSTDIIQQMDAAKLSVYNVTQATAAYTSSLKENGADSTITEGKYRTLVQTLTNVTGNNKEANTIAQTYSKSLGDDTEGTITLTTNTNKLGSALNALPKFENLSIAVKGLGSWTVTDNSNESISVTGGIEGTALRKARGGFIPGHGNADNQLILATPGELVVPKGLAPAAASLLGPMLKAHGVPGFAAGGLVGSISGSASMGALGSWAGSEYSQTVSAIAGSVAGAV
jgi:hypothetical protein